MVGPGSSADNAVSLSWSSNLKVLNNHFLERDTKTPVDTILKSYLLQPLETLTGAANFLTPSAKKKVKCSKIWRWRHEHAIACNPSITSHIASRCLWWALLYLHHIPIISSFDKTQMRKQKVAPLLFCWCNDKIIKPKVIVHPSTNLPTIQLWLV